MKNEIKKNVQEKINRSDWDLPVFYDVDALVILDNKYFIDKVRRLLREKIIFSNLLGIHRHSIGRDRVGKTK